jgi:hypothetical protein
MSCVSIEDYFMSKFRSVHRTRTGTILGNSKCLSGKQGPAVAPPLTLRSAIALALLPLMVPAAHAGNYTLTDLGIVGKGGEVVGVNKNGVVVGFSEFFSPAPGILANSFVWTPVTPNGTTGSAQEIPPPAVFDFCVAGGINVSGHVACDSSAVPKIWTGGTSFTSLPPLVASDVPSASGINDLDGVVGTGYNGSFHALWWPSGAVAPVVLDARGSVGSGLNNTGSFVGHVEGDDGVYHATAWAFVLLGVVPRTLNAELNTFSAADKINDGGTAIGTVDRNHCPDPNQCAFSFKPVAWAPGGAQTDLPLLYGSEGSPFDINAAGDIVGYSDSLVLFPNPHVGISAVLWHNGTVRDLNSATTLPSGWTLEYAEAINDSGQIAGQAVGPNGSVHAFLLTPIPNLAPVAKCKAVVASADATCSASASIDDGSYDPDSEIVSVSQSPDSPYSLGETLVLLTAKDGEDAASFCRATVTVQDNTPPAATCPSATSASAGASCKAAVPDVLGGVTATDNCSSTTNLSKTQDIAPGTLVGLGTTPIKVTVTDAAFNGGVCSTAFTVIDTSGPSLSASVAQPTLWTPSHELVNVGLSIAASDNCDAVASVQTTVFSNESDQPAGDADASFSPDARNIASGSLRVRAERLQAGSGRVYLVVAKSADSAGNASASCATVVVPHDQNAKSLAVVNALAAPAQTYCASHGGIAPTGYVAVGAGAVVGPKQ